MVCCTRGQSNNLYSFPAFFLFTLPNGGVTRPANVSQRPSCPLRAVVVAQRGSARPCAARRLIFSTLNLFFQRVVGVPSEIVAKYIQFNALGFTPVFKDSFKQIECDGNSVGSTRQITLPDGAVIDET